VVYFVAYFSAKTFCASAFVVGPAIVLLRAAAWSTAETFGFVVDATAGATVEGLEPPQVDEDEDDELLDGAVAFGTDGFGAVAFGAEGLELPQPDEDEPDEREDELELEERELLDEDRDAPKPELELPEEADSRLGGIASANAATMDTINLRIYLI
jgi:hypothetical protein